MTISPDEIRTLFSHALSDMYRLEVPLYGDLLSLAAEINAAVATEPPPPRLRVERHGAIRLGTVDELVAIRRLFAVMGMFPVGYYDLAQAGIPVHATAFRPVSAASLAINPFRVFTSLLRLDLIEDRALARDAERILARRRILTPRMAVLIAQAERAPGLDAADAHEFVAEAMRIFAWHADAMVDAPTYARLAAAHPLVADIVAFRGPHINHLTPRTLDIDAVHAAMCARGMMPKATIEGPPRRNVPILLRQTSFRAREEAIRFGDRPGVHTARFGEVEQRGVALTRAGRTLYDDLAQAGRLAEFPDEIDRALVFIDAAGQPITYEDFLPVSAAGIFRSNLGAAANLPDRRSDADAHAGRVRFTAGLGVEPADPFALYALQAEEALPA